MQLADRIERFKRLHQLIKRKGTGTPTELAERLGCSKSTVYRQIGKLKNKGAKIAYCPERKSYVYEEGFELKF